MNVGAWGSARPAGDGDLDFRALGAAIWRRKGVIALVTVAAALISGVVVQMVTPKYRSETRILYEGRENIFLRPDAEKQLDNSTLDEQAVTSQVQLLMSRDLARNVIRQLKLNEKPEFDPMLNGVSPLKVALSLFGFGRDPARTTQEERVLTAYFERISVFPVEKSRVLSLSFESVDPDLAAKVANAAAENYLALQQNAKQQQARQAGRWLSGEIDKLRLKVTEAEAKVEQFRSKNNLLVGTNNTTLSNQQLGEFNSQLAAARGQKADAEVRAHAIRQLLQSGRPIESTDVAGSDLMRRLAEQRLTVRTQLAEQLSTLLGQHPRIKELRAQLIDIDREMRIEAERMVRSLENDAKTAGARVESLTAALDQLKQQATQTNGQDVQLRALEREAKAQRDLLESYLAKYREAVARDTIDTAPGDARIISQASVSNIPAYPKKLPIIVISTLAAFLFSVGFVTIRELLRNQGPVEAVAVPAASNSEDARDSMPQPLSEPVAVSSLEDVVEALRRAARDARRITVVGDATATPDRATALARQLARDARVVLVDLSGRVLPGESRAAGLSDLIGGRTSFGAIIHRDPQSRLHLVGGGEGEPRGEALVASPRLAMICDALARAYDHVVVDAGPLGTPTISRLALLAGRAVLMVSEVDQATVRAGRDQLLAAGFTEVAVVAPPPASDQASAAA